MQSSGSSGGRHRTFDFFQPPPFMPSPAASSNGDATHSVDYAPLAIDYAAADDVFDNLTAATATATPPNRSPARTRTTSAEPSFDPIANLASRMIRPLPRSAHSPGQSSSPQQQQQQQQRVPVSIPQPAATNANGHGHGPTQAQARAGPSTKPMRAARNMSTVQQGEAAFRQAEVDRRNKAREDQKLQRQKELQRQVDLNMKAAMSEREEARAKLLSQRDFCAAVALGLDPDGRKPEAERPIGKLDIDEAIGRQVYAHWQTSRPTDEAMRVRQGVVERIQTAIDRRWPGYGLVVAPFGSSITGLVSDGSDLDLVLLDPSRPFGVGTPQYLERPPARRVRLIEGMPDWYNVKVVAAALRQKASGPGQPDWFRNILAISSANVPIVKFVDSQTGIPADLNINERFGLINSQLVRTYADLQPDIFRPMVYFLKHWLSQRGLNDPSGSKGPMSLSSYTIALMAIQYLQIAGLLPNLQDPRLIKQHDVRRSFAWRKPKRAPRKGAFAGLPDGMRPLAMSGYDVTFAPLASMEYRDRAYEQVRANSPDAASPAAKLLGQSVRGFINYYEGHFARREFAVSIVSGRPLQLERDGFPERPHTPSQTDSESLPTGSPSTDGSGPAEATTSATAIDEREPSPPGVLAMDDFSQPRDWLEQEIVVQDPFIVDRNTSRNVGARMVHRLESELQRAKRLLSCSLQAESPLRDMPLICDVCAPPSVDVDRIRFGDDEGHVGTMVNGEDAPAGADEDGDGRGYANNTLEAHDAAQEERREAQRLKEKRNAEQRKEKAKARAEAARLAMERRRADEARMAQPAATPSNGHATGAGSRSGNGHAADSLWTVDRTASTGGEGGKGGTRVEGSPSLSTASETSEDIDLVALRLERAKVRD